MDWITASKTWKESDNFTATQHDLQDRLEGVAKTDVPATARRIRRRTVV